MSAGKGGSTTYTTPTLTPEQRQQLDLQNQFASETLIPTYKGIVSGAESAYNQSKGGVLNAAQNLAGTANQAQQTLGETGESALRTGVSGLESLFSKDYENQQLNAAMAPAQAQYMQNLAAQQAQFGGSGNLGSARQALAGQQLAGQTQATQAATAAGILKDIAAQRASVGSNLAQLGQGGIGQAIGAAGQGVNASQIPLSFFNQFASVPFGVPGQSYALGPTGTSSSSSSNNIGIKI